MNNVQRMIESLVAVIICGLLIVGAIIVLGFALAGIALAIVTVLVFVTVCEAVGVIVDCVEAFCRATVRLLKAAKP